MGKDKRIERDERRIAHDVKRLERDEAALKSLFVKSFRILKGECHVKDKGVVAVPTVGVVAGSSGKFTAVPVPAGAAVTGAPTWTSDNALAVVSSDTSDPSGLSIIVAVDVSLTNSFNLTVKSTNPDGSVATGTLNVPVLAAAPVPVTSFDIVQTA